MYSIVNKPEQCIECKHNNRNDGWFNCQGFLFRIKELINYIEN